MLPCDLRRRPAASDRCINRQRRFSLRKGAATVELSLLLPLLLFLLFAAMDFSRVFYASIIVSNCARNGALFLSDPNMADKSPYATVEEAVAADADDVAGLLQVSTLSGTDPQGYGWSQVTVVYPFQTVVTYPGIPSQLTISRTVRMRNIPVTP